MKNTIISGFLFLLLSVLSYAQHIPSGERGDPLFRTNGQMEFNRLKATFFNHGVSGRYDGSQPISIWTPYEWPKNSGQVYMAMQQLFIGAEVKDKSGKTIQIVEVSNGRTSPQGKTWSLEPVPGYFTGNPANRNSIANSRRKETWPQLWPEKIYDASDPGWPGSWNGYFGKNKFFNGEELYYKFTDNLYNRYPNYDPDSTDLTRRGLGLVVSCRIVEFADPLLEDMVFHIYKIKNDGTKTIEKASAAFWIADFIGGEGDSQDDKVGYDIPGRTIWFYDTDKKAPTFGKDPVGMMGLKIIRAPFNNDHSGQQLGLTGLQIKPPGYVNLSSATDYQLWYEFMRPGTYADPAAIAQGEYDSYISCSYFSLRPGEETEIIVAYIMANGSTHDEELNRFKAKARLAEEYFLSLYAENKYNITLSTPAAGQAVSGNLNITYSLTGNGDNTRNLIFHSSDDGKIWELLGIDSLNTGSFSINTASMKEGVLNRLAVYSFSQNGYAFSQMTRPFTIKNPSTTVKPQINFASPAADDTLSGEYSVMWNGGDADGDSFKVNLYYRLSSTDSWKVIVKGLKQADSYSWNTRDFPNSGTYQLKGEIVSGSDTESCISGQFSVYNQRIVYPDEIIDLHGDLQASGIFEVRVVNPQKINGHNYSVTFNDVDDIGSTQQNPTYNITDLSAGSSLLFSNLSTIGQEEGPEFDGVRLYIKNQQTAIDPVNSRWNNNGIAPFKFEKFAFNTTIKGFRKASNYKIVFDNNRTGKSIAKEVGTVNFPSKPVNFNVYNTTTNQKIDFVFMEIDSTKGGGPGYFSCDGSKRDRIVFWEKAAGGNMGYTYWVYLTDNLAGRFPASGDTLNINQFLAFSSQDTIYFSTQKIFTGVDNDNSSLPSDYSLDQNYPNPFNPTTRIRFTLAESGPVSLKLYDTLGREVKTLLQEEKHAGTHIYEFHAGSLASGVYIYRLQAGSFSSNKKLVLIK